MNVAFGDRIKKDISNWNQLHVQCTSQRSVAESLACTILNYIQAKWLLWLYWWSASRWDADSRKALNTRWLWTWLCFHTHSPCTVDHSDISFAYEIIDVSYFTTFKIVCPFPQRCPKGNQCKVVQSNYSIVL